MSGSTSIPSNRAMVAAFREQLRHLGWTESENFRIELRFGEGDLARGRALAAELVAMNPDVLLSENTPLVQELQRLTRTIPIVFPGIADPVVSGIVGSLARPGGNATGFMNPEPELATRWLQLLKEIAPSLLRVLVLVNAGNVGTGLRAIEAAAPSFGMQVSSAAIRSEADVEDAMSAAAGQGSRPHHPGNAVGHRRRGDRITTSCPKTHSDPLRRTARAACLTLLGQYSARSWDGAAMAAFGESCRHR
jgi:putative tryptophan/tyrosine transport system substrate-binding protein